MASFKKVESFQDYLNEKEKLSLSTQKSYQSIIDQFQSDYHPNERALLENRHYYRQIIYAWITDLTSNQKAQSLNKRITAIKHYFKFLEIKYDQPLKYQIQLKYRRVHLLPKFLDVYQEKRVDMILNSLKLSHEDLTILMLIRNHGVTVKEIQNIKLNEFKASDQMIITQSSYTYARYIFLNEPECQMIQKQIKNEGNEMFLFQRKISKETSPKPCSRYRVYKIFKQLNQISNFKITPSLLRTTFIKSCLENGMPEHVLSSSLGLKYVNTIIHYQKINSKRISEQYLKAFNQIRFKQQNLKEKEERQIEETDRIIEGHFRKEIEQTKYKSSK